MFMRIIEGVMTRKWLLVVLAVGSVACSGSKQEPAKPPEPPKPQTFRGFFISNGKVNQFQTCGAPQVLWAVDKSGEMNAVYEKLNTRQGSPLDVEVVGTVGPAPPEAAAIQLTQQLTITKLRRASSEGNGCTEDLGPVEFRAFGSEPKWSSEIYPRGGISLIRAAESRTEFPYVPAKVTGAARLYESKNKDHTFEVTITEERCVDPSSGNLYAYSVTALLDGKPMKGCAVDNWKLPK